MKFEFVFRKCSQESLKSDSESQRVTSHKSQCDFKVHEVCPRQLHCHSLTMQFHIQVQLQGQGHGETGTEMMAAPSAVAEAETTAAQTSVSLSIDAGVTQAAPLMATDTAAGPAGPGPGGGKHGVGTSRGRQEAAALLVAQRAEVLEQLVQLQRVLGVQADCTGRHALEEEVAARVLGDGAGGATNTRPIRLRNWKHCLNA